MRTKETYSTIELAAVSRAIEDLPTRNQMRPAVLSNPHLRLLLEDLQTKDYLKLCNDKEQIFGAWNRVYGKRSWFKLVLPQLEGAVPSKNAYADLLVADTASRASGALVHLRNSLASSPEEFFNSLATLYHTNRAQMTQEAPTLYDLYVNSLGAPVVYLPTPFAALNKSLGGLATGRLHILGARTGIGKSSMAIEIASHLAKKEEKILYCCLEMGGDEIVERFAKSLGLPWGKDVAKNAKLLQRYPNLLVQTNPAISLLEIENAVFNHRPNLVVIDYLGLMQLDANSTDQALYRRIGALSKGLQAIAKKYRTAVLALSQLKRPSLITKKTSEVEPEISDLKESGELEQDADTVILLHRENIMSDVAEVLIKKNRHGPCTRFMLSFTQGRFFNNRLMS